VYTTNTKDSKYSKYQSENEPYKKKRKPFRPLKPLVLRPYIALPALKWMIEWMIRWINHPARMSWCRGRLPCRKGDYKQRRLQVELSQVKPIQLLSETLSSKVLKRKSSYLWSPLSRGLEYPLPSCLESIYLFFLAMWLLKVLMWLYMVWCIDEFICTDFYRLL
jgi:hypothetical protein